MTTRRNRITETAFTEAAAVALHKVFPANDPATILNLPCNRAPAKTSARDSDNVRRLGYDMGVLSAAHWPSVRSSERFKCMTIVDYRDLGTVDCLKTLKDQSYSGDFITGFIMGFEDEAMDRAEAGLAGYKDVREAGSVDGSVAVTLRRTLVELDDLISWHAKALHERKEVIINRLAELRTKSTRAQA